jgi:hypothetical protein
MRREAQDAVETDEDVVVESRETPSEEELSDELASQREAEREAEAQDVRERSSYKALLSAEGVARLVPAMVVARLPLGMMSVLLVLQVSSSLGAGVAGATTAALTLGTAIFAPLLGKGVDHGIGPALLRATSVVQLVLMLVLLYAAQAGAPAALVLLIAFLTGSCTPPVAGTTRSLWAHLVRPELLDMAYSFEVLLVDVLYVTGPLLASLFIGLGMAGAGLVFAVGGQAVGSWMLAASKPVHAYAEAGRTAGGRRRTAADDIADDETERAEMRGLLSSVGVRLLLLVCLATNAFSGALETLLPLWYDSLGQPGRSGFVISVWSIGSILGVIGFSRFQPSTRRIPLPRQLVLFSAVYLAVSLSLALYSSHAALSVAAFAIGCFVSPCTNLHYQLSGALAPKQRHGEMFSWVNTATSAGLSLGSFAIGLIVEGGSFLQAFLFPSVFLVVALALAATLMAWARRRGRGVA